MYSVTIVSIVRLHYLLQGNLTSPDITWNFVDIALWSVLEGNVAIFCGKKALIYPISLTASSEITIQLFGG